LGDLLLEAKTLPFTVPAIFKSQPLPTAGQTSMCELGSADLKREPAGQSGEHCGEDHQYGKCRPIRIAHKDSRGVDPMAEVRIRPSCEFWPLLDVEITARLATMIL
jgi:hypothetical protein